MDMTFFEHTFSTRALVYWIVGPSFTIFGVPFALGLSVMVIQEGARFEPLFGLMVTLVFSAAGL